MNKSKRPIITQELKKLRDTLNNKRFSNTGSLYNLDLIQEKTKKLLIIYTGKHNQQVAHLGWI
jgi:hypothetical protein